MADLTNNSDSSGPEQTKSVRAVEPDKTRSVHDLPKYSPEDKERPSDAPRSLQSVIDAAVIRELEAFKSGARKAQGLLGGHAMISADEIIRQVDMRLAALRQQQKAGGE